MPGQEHSRAVKMLVVDRGRDQKAALCEVGAQTSPCDLTTQLIELLRSDFDRQHGFHLDDGQS